MFVLFIKGFADVHNSFTLCLYAFNRDHPEGGNIMDNQENQIPENAPIQEPVVPVIPVLEEAPATQAAEQSQAEPARKNSPFADSPYVTTHREPEITPGYTMPAAGSKKSEKRSGWLWKKAIAAVLVVALVAGSCCVTAAMVNGYWEDRTAQMTDDVNQRLELLEQELEEKIQEVENTGNSVSGTPNTSADGLTPSQVYAQNVASTVLVYSEVVKMGQRGYSTGSGFILTQDGYVVTNHHVIEGGTTYVVVTSDNVQHDAVLVGSDASNDVAVLKMEGDNLKAVTVGSSDALIVGDQVAAIGNPLGKLTSTLTVGYVSAKGRYVTTESTTINMIQTDCAINSGNSGGPLFNMKGEVVGITTAKYSGTSGSGASIEGIGFAIPIDDVIAIVEDLVEFGYVNSAYLGIEVNNQNEIQAGLPSGAYVKNVITGYCAEKAGIQAGDYIVELDGHEVSTMNDLTRILRGLNPGTTTTVVVLRGSNRITLEITLDARPRESGEESPAQQMPLPEDGNFDEWYEYFRWFFENQEKP